MVLKSEKTGGGRFLIDRIDKETVVTPEDFTEEQLMFAETTKSFIDKSVVPHDQQIESLDYDLTVKLLREAGELGLLGADVPEPFGGLGLDKVSAALITESLAKGSSFCLSASVHTGIGTLPIVFFGNKKQKEKYLPDLASGQKIAAYCLTEPASGSDALSARTTARLSEDGKYYLLNGQKQFITNAGFADLFIVYAKIDGRNFTAFIVERTMDGVSLGPEEKKMGIKGSSTRPVIFEDVKVPVENLLGEVGRGHIIAFNILNIGRFKLGMTGLGAAKEAIELATKFANERIQFGKPVSSFPLIQKKLAEMNTKIYALESIVYRTAGLIDESLKGVDHTSPEAGHQSAKGIAEYAIECSINKVFGSETLQAVADEGVQIHGGYGYTQEYKIERIYRDSRINRIFEGTNEINRLVIVSTLLKKDTKGELPLFEKIKALEIESPESSAPSGILAGEAGLVSRAKRLVLLALREATNRYERKLLQNQQVIGNLSDIIIQIFTMESVLLRSMKRLEKLGSEKADNSLDMAQLFIQKGFEKVESLTKEVLVDVTEDDALKNTLAVAGKLTKRVPVNLMQVKTKIASHVIRTGGYTV
ncbi:acyl-CoA dehydrogenase family protein [Sporolactobacillus sp. CQH2019]|uniref:acyl-CoA dehydrogenase family protein n=1 Tax=Sporolactobacillus sp. CQH2019 TaxID=3023512 RepID=UPI002367671B|nr:acyl-CoA dehydrogenase family protein [Sporolactobacillus sp. CQH2019]MDD9150199.1 acyl-CoA dehydrogenase family protein [Sporolactobacillus sp. CQH2019]